MPKRLIFKEGSNLSNTGPVQSGFRMVGYEGATFSQKVNSVITDISSQLLQTFELTGALSASEINDLDVSSITLLSAPGVNKYYVLESTCFHYKFVSTPYTCIKGLGIFYNNGLVKVASVLSNSLLTGSNSGIFINNYLYGVDLQEFSTDIINDSIVVKLDGGSISGGDGTINYSIKYRIVTTS